MTYMAFKNDGLFVQRVLYLESSNRTSYRVGSIVLSARVSGGAKVAGLNEPVTLTFGKDEVSNNQHYCIIIYHGECRYIDYLTTVLLAVTV